MDANELFMGMTVIFNCISGSQIIVSVTGFDGVFVSGQSEQGSHWCRIDKVEPIPLTLEILEKLGFRKSVSPPGIHAKCYEIDNKDKKYHLTIANYNKYKRLLLNVDSEDSECFNIKCDYVHQLQRALKLCRIKKEIIL